MHKSKLILCFLYFLKNLASNKKRKPISKAKHSRSRKLLNKKFGLSGLGKELQLRRNKIWKARRRIKIKRTRRRMLRRRNKKTKQTSLCPVGIGPRSFGGINSGHTTAIRSQASG
jgi:hypothetical protein